MGHVRSGSGSHEELRGKRLHPDVGKSATKIGPKKVSANDASQANGRVPAARSLCRIDQKATR